MNLIQTFLNLLLLFIECQGPGVLLLHLLYGAVPDGQPEGSLGWKPERYC